MRLHYDYKYADYSSHGICTYTGEKSKHNWYSFLESEHIKNIVLTRKEDIENIKMELKNPDLSIQRRTDLLRWLGYAQKYVKEYENFPPTPTDE